MYFPKLSILKDYRFDDLMIDQLDSWLGTRRIAVRKYLSPIQFSYQTGIREDAAIHMFALCVQPNIALLKPRYLVECKKCEYRIVEVFESAIDVPQKLYCGECDRTFDVSSDDIIIWFQLLEEPATPEYLNTNGKAGDYLGKSMGLRNTVAANSPEDVVRRLSVTYEQRGMGI